MCRVSCVMCHVSCVMCHVSCVMCHVSCVMCHVSCVMCNVQCAMCNVQCAMCNVQSAMSMLESNTAGREADVVVVVVPVVARVAADFAFADAQLRGQLHPGELRWEQRRERSVLGLHVLKKSYGEVMFARNFELISMDPSYERICLEDVVGVKTCSCCTCCTLTCQDVLDTWIDVQCARMGFQKVDVRMLVIDISCSIAEQQMIQEPSSLRQAALCVTWCSIQFVSAVHDWTRNLSG